MLVQMQGAVVVKPDGTESRIEITSRSLGCPTWSDPSDTWIGHLEPGITNAVAIPNGRGRVFFYRSTDGWLQGWYNWLGAMELADGLIPWKRAGWTHLAALGSLDGVGSVLFYDATDGSGAVGVTSATRTFQPGDFRLGWTHLVSCLNSGTVLFYDNGTGEAALGFDPSTDIPGFSKGWTAIAATNHGDGDLVLFHNHLTGSTTSGFVSSAGTFSELRDITGFGVWDMLVGLRGGFLAIDSATGTARLIDVDESGAVSTAAEVTNESFGGQLVVVAAEPIEATRTIEGLAWPISAAPGETIDFRVSSTVPTATVRYTSVRLADPTDITDTELDEGLELIPEDRGDPFSIATTLQPPHRPEEGCADWPVTFSLAVTDAWESGLYFARVIRDDDAEFDIPFVVEPAPDRRARVAVVANLCTWNAYNTYGGYSRYKWINDDLVGWDLSFMRPLPLGINLNPSALRPWALGKSDPWADYHYNSAHLVRSELWTLAWLRQEGLRPDVFTDVDMHNGDIPLGEYELLILDSHPEYLTTEMVDQLNGFLDGGGNLVYIGGNAMWDRVTIDFDRLTMNVAAGNGHSPRLRSFAAKDVADLLTVNFVDNDPDRSPFIVTAPEHRLFAGMGLRAGDTLGDSTWASYDAYGAHFNPNGACGWEVDHAHPDLIGSNVEVLATATHDSKTGDVTFKTHPGGGIVVAIGSMAAPGSLPTDDRIQAVVRKALFAALT